MNTNNILDFLRSRKYAVIVSVFIGVIIIAGSFSLGVLVGYNKARFSYAWGENYNRNFGGPRNGFFGNLDGRGLIDSHGTFGQILKIDNANLIVKGPDGVEKIILVADDTEIRLARETLSLANLKAGDSVVIIGEPNATGQIVAKLIRVMPPMPLQSLSPTGMPLR